jgi:ferredoxin
MVSEGFQKWRDDPVTKITAENSPRRLEMVRRTQDVIFDHERCTNPEECLKCVKVCSPHVLAFFPTPTRPTGETIPPPRVLLFLPEMCNLCNLCVEVCPEKALSIKVYGGRPD